MTSVVFMVLCESTVKIFTSLKQFLTDFSHIFYDYDQTDLQIKYMSLFLAVDTLSCILHTYLC